STEGAGGFIGKIENKGKTITVTNSAISDCSLSSKENSSNADKEKPVGGIAGAVLSNSNIIGYNILAKNVQISRTRSNGINRAGDVIGYIDTGCSFKLVGLSTPKPADGSYMKKDVGTNKGDLHLIFADYEGACLAETPNEIPSSVNNGSASNVGDMGSFPYVTVNPSVSFITDPEGTGDVLTGDGVSSTALTNILDDIGESSAESKKAYHNVDSYAASFNSGNFSEKLSTFKAKTGASVEKDFPVIVLNESDAKITGLLNSCIHLLTNNSDIGSYAKADEKNRFSISIACYSYDSESGKFILAPEEDNSLRIENGNFVMVENKYDSAYNNRFTLIDVQYYAPDGSGNIAYHLYLPVYVEKMLKFNFTIGALSGTKYNADLYKDILGLVVLENYGTPVTAYLTYSYLRTAAEWQDAINGGENLLTGYGKSVVIKDGHLFPDDTKIALVDRNRDGRAYYGDISSAYTVGDGKLDFGSFKASDDTAFSPVPFIELLLNSADITAEESESGALVRCTQEEATVKIGAYYYKQTTTEEGPYYNAVVTPKAGMT
ncbi:MAG: hypothetical protein ACI4J4_11360, partial [Ruminiclostridium sp.]